GPAGAVRRDLRNALPQLGPGPRDDDDHRPDRPPPAPDRRESAARAGLTQRTLLRSVANHRSIRLATLRRRVASPAGRAGRLAPLTLRSTNRDAGETQHLPLPAV